MRMGAGNQQGMLHHVWTSDLPAVVSLRTPTSSRPTESPGLALTVLCLVRIEHLLPGVI